MADFLQTSVQIRLEVILYTDEALRDFGKLSFITSHLFSAGGRHASSVMELFVPIEILEEILTEVQGIIKSYHLSPELIINF